MPLLIDVEGHHAVGRPNHIESHSPDHRFAVVFQDNGDTGHFFAIDPAAEGEKVQDGLLVYDVAGVPEPERMAHLHIGWSTDARKAVLLVNGAPQAVFDFDAKRGFCHSALPEPNPDSAWSQAGHAWSDTTADLFA